MSAQTKDYVAHARHLGRTMYHATIVAWEPDPAERDYRARRTSPNLGLAKAWARDWLPQHATAVGSDTDIWVEVERGAWETDRFDDDEHGTITDAVWTVDESWRCEGRIGDDGTIEWEAWDQ